MIGRFPVYANRLSPDLTANTFITGNIKQSKSNRKPILL